MAILFPYEPNWAAGVRIDHAFRTEIITSRNYREQRSALRLQPRKSVEFTMQGRRGSLAAMQAFLAKNLQGEFVLPDVTRFVDLTASAASGTLTLTLAAVPFWAYPGQTIRLVFGAQSTLAEIDAVSATQILLTANLTQTYPVGTRVYATMTGYLSQQTRGRLRTNTVGEFPITFEANPGSFEEPDGSAPLTFNGRELFLTKPNWADAPQAEIVGYLESVDFDRGVWEQYAPVTFQTRRLQLSYLGRGEKAETFMQFFRRMKGQRGEFYMPTWEPDIDVSIGALSGATSLVVPGSAFREAYSGSTVYKALIVFFRDGAHEAKTISSIVNASGNSRINVPSGWTRAVNTSSVRLACLLPVWRFGVDNIAVNWETDNAAQWRATVQTLEDLA